MEPGQSVEVQGESSSATHQTAPRMLNASLHTLCGGEIPVMLQAMKEEPPLAAKCKDKFLIQSTTITPEKETLSLSDIVSSPPSPILFPLLTNRHLNFPSSLRFAQRLCLRMTIQWNTTDGDTHSQKIRVSYLPPEGTNIPEEEEPAPGPPVSAFSPPEVSAAYVAWNTSCVALTDSGLLLFASSRPTAALPHHTHRQRS